MTATVETDYTLDQALIMEILVELNIMGEDEDPSAPLKWTESKAKAFLAHPAFDGFVDDFSTNQIRKRKTGQELFDLMLEESGEDDESEDSDQGDDEPQSTNRTVNPATLRINSLDLSDSKGKIVSNAKCDGSKDIPDTFKTEDLSAFLANPFTEAFQKVSELALSQIKPFCLLTESEGMNRELIRISRSTKGKNEKKVDLIMFTIRNTRGADGNKMSSGELTYDKCSVELLQAIRELEDTLLPIYRRPTRVETEGVQKKLFEDPSSNDDGEGEEPVDD